MKNLPTTEGIRQILIAGDYKGKNRAHGRVTVEPYWGLNKTASAYAEGNRGPYRWFQKADDSQWEVEVPNIQSIEISRDIDQPVASCTIRMYNQWHNLNAEIPELVTQLGKPGYFWFERGKAGTDPLNRWNQSPATGGVTRSGAAAIDDGQPFSWTNVLVPNALIRTYQGYGGHGLSIDAALASHNLTRTGVWMIDTVVAGTDGMLTLTCRDMGRLLMNQRVFPPLVPDYLYPLDYYPDGSFAFDSPWEPPLTGTGVTSVSRGVIPVAGHGSSLGIRYNGDPLSNPVIDGHYVTDAKDNNPKTWSWSAASPNPDDNTEYWEFTTLPVGGTTAASCSEFTLYPWGGGYTMYVSIYESGAWVPHADPAVGNLTPHVKVDGSNDIIGGYPYVATYPIPHAEPGHERPLTFDLPRAYNMQSIRITLRHNKLSTGGYRCGIRDIVCLKVAEPLTLETITALPNITCVGITKSGGSGGTLGNGYWVLDSGGHVYGFGDAADYDETLFGGPASHCETSFWGVTNPNNFVAMVGHPDGQGYWVLEANGYISAFGTAAHMGHNVRWTGTRALTFDSLVGDLAVDIAVNSDGTGYWVIYSDGQVWGFGAEGGGSNVFQCPLTDVAIFSTAIMNSRMPKFQAYIGTTIVGHPTAAPGTSSFWCTNGWGEVFANGQCGHFGQFTNAVGPSGPLGPDEWIWSMDCTDDGSGYWLVGGSGRIAQFGSAVGKGETDLYKDYRNMSPPDDPYVELSPEVLRDTYNGMIRDICRGHDKPDPELGGVGGGYYALTGGGRVIAINENEWGSPSWWGRSGFKWHQGTFQDYTDIVKEMLLWSGFLLYDSVTPALKVHGDLEKTGIKSDHKLSTDTFDKKTILEVINLLREVVGYTFWIDDEGAAHFESANVWSSGNFITNGAVRTHVLDYPTPIDERTNLISYSALADGSQLVSEIITGSTTPMFQIPQEINHVRLEAVNAVAPIKTSTEHGTATPLRGMENPMMYTNAMFKDSEEMRIMAELIALRIWFSQRTGSVKMVCDPSIQINDQVQIIERNTSDTNYHYVRGVTTSMNLDTGEYTAQLSTNWLGSQASWTITRSAITDGLRQVKISEIIDRWQTLAAGENNRPSLVTGRIGLGSAEHRLEWHFLQNDYALVRPLSGGSNINVGWTATGLLTVSPDATGAGLTGNGALVSVEAFQADYLGSFTVTINGTAHAVSQLGTTFYTGALPAGAHTVTVTHGDGAKRAGQSTLALKISAATAGASLAKTVFSVSDEKPLPFTPASPVGPRCQSIDLNSFVADTASSSLAWRVVFSEPVTGLAAANFTVRKTGTVAGGTVSFTGSGDTYIVTVSGLTGVGKVGLDLTSAQATVLGWPSGTPMPPLTTIGKNYNKTA